MKWHHDGEHLSEGELASPVALKTRGNQVVTLPLLNELGKIVKTAEQGNGSLQ